MPGKIIPFTDHVCRLCGGTKCDDDGRPTGSAFMLRPGKDDYLSVNWLEHTGAKSRNDQLDIVREHFLNKDMVLPATAKFGVLLHQITRNHVSTETKNSREIIACHEPTLPADPSHSGIYGFGPDDQLIADLIAETVCEIHPARGQLPTSN